MLRTIVREYSRRRAPLTAVPHRQWTGSHPVGINKRPPVESLHPASVRPTPAWSNKARPVPTPQSKRIAS